MPLDESLPQARQAVAASIGHECKGRRRHPAFEKFTRRKKNTIASNNDINPRLVGV